MSDGWVRKRRMPDERGTYATAMQAIRLFREGQIDEAEDVNPMAVDIFRSWCDTATEDVAEDQTLDALFGDDPIPGEEVNPWPAQDND